MKPLRLILPITLFILSGVLAWVGTYCLPETEGVGFELWISMFAVIFGIGFFPGIIWALYGFND